LRVFLAVPADAAWVESARKLVGSLSSALPRASWTRPESWHLTLKFLGEIPVEAAERFASEIGERVAAAPGGELSGGGAILLPPRGRPRVLGVGFAASSSALPPLAGLARIAEEAARRVGAPAEDRAFRPHVTLGRVRVPWAAAAVESFRTATDAWAFPDWPVRSCVLYQSRLQPTGAIHTPLRQWEMAPSISAVRA
jgi:2'-5' RNA ligase